MSSIYKIEKIKTEKMTDNLNARNQIRIKKIFFVRHAESVSNKAVCDLFRVWDYFKWLFHI